MSDEEKRPEAEEEASATTSEESVGEDKKSEGSPSESPAAEAAAAEESSDESEDGAHGHGGHDDDHFAHTSPMALLIGVLVALLLLTILTVGVTAVDLGSQGNFIVAMIIATVKAGLVMAYFMHMVWDSKFNVVAFTSSFLFVLLFLAMSLTDRGEYQNAMDSWESDKKLEEM